MTRPYVPLSVRGDKEPPQADDVHAVTHKLVVDASTDTIESLAGSLRDLPEPMQKAPMAHRPSARVRTSQRAVQRFQRGQGEVSPVEFYRG